MSTIMGWLHNRTIDDFKLIHILNEVNCKHVVKLNISFLNEILFTILSYFLLYLKINLFHKLISRYTYSFAGGHRR
jgi:hypothetical protein